MKLKNPLLGPNSTSHSNGLVDPMSSSSFFGDGAADPGPVMPSITIYPRSVKNLASRVQLFYCGQRPELALLSAIGARFGTLLCPSLSWDLMVGRHPLWVAKQHGHSITTMLRAYAAWAEGAIEADIEAIQHAMDFSPRAIEPAKASTRAVARKLLDRNAQPRVGSGQRRQSRERSIAFAVQRDGDRRESFANVGDLINAEINGSPRQRTDNPNLCRRS
jgi:hypothetical protein